MLSNVTTGDELGRVSQYFMGQQNTKLCLANDLFFSTEEGTDITFEKEYNILCVLDFEGIFLSAANGQPMI